MAGFDSYKGAFPHAKLSRSPEGAGEAFIDHIDPGRRRGARPSLMNADHGPY